jgi:hypothetical protein
MDYWWAKRDAKGQLWIESRSPETDARFHQTIAPGQTLSLATSLLESAGLVAGMNPALAETMRVRARQYIEGFLSAPHDLEKGVFLIMYRQGSRPLVEAMPVWGSRYGIWPASYVALTALCAHSLTGDARLLVWAEAAARGYLGLPFPRETAVPAMDAGLGLGLMAELFLRTQRTEWLEGGLRLAGEMLGAYWDASGGLPRGASGIDWYESQMGPGFLLHGLTRLALLAQDAGRCSLDADYTAR